MTDENKKNVLVTGGSRGIGRSTCLKFAKMGMNVVVNYKSNNEAAMNVVNEIANLGSKGLAIMADVANPENVESMFKEISETFSAKDFFNTRVSNYKTLASIYKLFLVETTKIDFNPKQIIDTKYTILESITSKPKKQKPSSLVETLRKEERDTQLLSYQILVDKFNKKYNNLIPLGDYETIGGYIIEQLGRIPNKNEHLFLQIGQILIRKASSKRIEQVQIFIN